MRKLRFELLEARRVLSGDPIGIVHSLDPHSQTEIESVLVQLEAPGIAVAESTSGGATGDPLADSIQPFLTTTGNPNDYLIAPGNGFEGVAALLLNSGTSLCSATLLPTGRHVATAAHCFTDDNGVPNVTDVVAVFTLSGGNIGYSGTTVTIHPAWLGDDFLQEGGDIAILELSQEVSAEVPRHDIYRQTDEIGNTFDKVGFGQRALGATGTTAASPSGVKLAGKNTFDAAAEQLNSETLILGGTPVTLPSDFFTSGGHLLFDFDSGVASGDAAGDILGITDTGLGTDEVSTALGDSGGPAFIDGKIAGITSFGLTNGGTDTDGTTNSSFGEFAFDTRVSTYAAWIDTVVDIVGPQVTSVVIANTVASVSHDYSTVDGSGAQLSTAPVGTADRYSITFSEDLDPASITEDSLRIVGLTTANVPTIVPNAFSYDPVTDTATWDFDGVVPNDMYALILSDSVTDIAGNRLDGEWTNPTDIDSTSGSISTFPSGDGSPGGHFVFVVTLLGGDMDGDNSITAQDIQPFITAVSSSTPTPQGDMDGDGSTTTQDISPFLAALANGISFNDVLLRADLNNDGLIDQDDFDIYGNDPSAYDPDNDGIFGGASDDAFMQAFEDLLTDMVLPELDIQLA